MARETGLTGIYITSGVNEKAQGFCSVAAHGEKGAILAGQLSPGEVRALAMQWLEAAEAAEQEAAALQVIRRLELPLRELARLADDAIAAVARSERSEFSAASVVRMFRDTLDEYAPPPVAPLDPRQDQLMDAARDVLNALDHDEA